MTRTHVSVAVRLVKVDAKGAHRTVDGRIAVVRAKTDDELKKLPEDAAFAAHDMVARMLVGDDDEP